MSTATASANDDLPSATELTPEERAENRRYGHLELLCQLADRAIDFCFLVIMAFLIAPHIRLVMRAAFPVETMQLLAYFWLMTSLHMVVSFPLSYYSGYALEHQFRLSRQSLGRWLSRYLKQMALYVVFMSAMLVGLYWVIWIFGPWWWIVAAAAFFLVSVVAGQLAPVLILPLFYKIERLNQPELAERINRLAQGTGLTIEGVYRMDLSAETVKANAMLAGFGRTRRVLFGDTLLTGFTPDEIEVIFAHEVGHHVYRHISKFMFIGLIYSAIGFWLCDRLTMAWARQYEPTVDYSTFPAFALPMIMFVLWVFAMLREPLDNAISRHFERQCDQYALDHTSLRAAYVSAFRKLARLNKDNPSPHPLEVFLFHSHPPISERLAMADLP